MGFIQKKMGTTQPSEYHFAKDSAKLIRQGLDPRLPITNIRKLQVVDYRGPAPPGTLVRYTPSYTLSRPGPRKESFVPY